MLWPHAGRVLECDMHYCVRAQLLYVPRDGRYSEVVHRLSSAYALPSLVPSSKRELLAGGASNYNNHAARREAACKARERGLSHLAVPCRDMPWLWAAVSRSKEVPHIPSNELVRDDSRVAQVTCAPVRMYSIAQCDVNLCKGRPDQDGSVALSNRLLYGQSREPGAIEERQKR